MSDWKVSRRTADVLAGLLAVIIFFILVPLLGWMVLVVLAAYALIAWWVIHRDRARRGRGNSTNDSRR